ncbi:MAG: regulatory protein MarR [Acidimicrobiales bacterium]|jgi:DNA-binding MarR family transcriptional regulator|nr:regulatory protein MarR [Acidimicrobiales bacterium]
MAKREDARIEVWRRFLVAHAALVDVLERELQEEHGLPLAWYDVLVQLNTTRGRRRMSELAESVLISRSGLTRLIDRMEAAGLVAREQSRNDRRGSEAVLTADGLAALREAAPTHLRGVEEHFSRHLTVAEAKAIGAGLGKVIDASSRAGQANC